jgi:hypothetical protein
MTTLTRLELLAEATAIEAAGGQWNALHVGAVLGMARKTVYDTPWLRKIALPRGNGRHSWDPATVRKQQQAEAARRSTRLRRARAS